MSHPNTIESYGKQSLQTIKYFHFSPPNDRTIILIHGGAWRDPNNTYDDFIPLYQHLMRKKTNDFNIVGINYRLSPDVKHPAHLLDVISALLWIQKHTPTKHLLLVGHSVGATLILQLLNYKEILGQLNLTVSGNPILGVDIVYFVDGIYDIPKLIEEYGDAYKEFVMCAFSIEEEYKNATQLSMENFRQFGHTPKKIVICQSTEDELLSERQTDLLTLYLSEYDINFTLYRENWGLHEEVYRREELADLILKNESSI